MFDPKEIPCPETLGLKVLDPKKILVKKSQVQKLSKKDVVQEIKVQNNLGPKNCLVQNDLGSKSILSPKHFGFNKIWIQKHFGSEDHKRRWDTLKLSVEHVQNGTTVAIKG